MSRVTITSRPKEAMYEESPTDTEDQTATLPQIPATAAAAEHAPPESARRIQKQPRTNGREVSKELEGSLVREIQVVVCDVRDTDDEHSHPAFGPMNDAWRNVDQRSFTHRMLIPIEQHHAVTLQNVVQLCRPLVIVLAGTVDVDSMRPRGHFRVFAADQPIPLSAGAALTRRFAFVSHERLQGGRVHVGRRSGIGSRRGARMGPSALTGRRSSIPMDDGHAPGCDGYGVVY